MKKILVIGSSNTDMTVKTSHLPCPGETVLGGRFVMGPGGKGANQAVAVARLGGSPEFICKTGNDMFGHQAIENYRKEGISVKHCIVSPTHSGVALISVDAEGENCIVVASGANAEVSVQEIVSLSDVISSFDILLLQLEIPVPAVLEAARIASEAGVFVMLNPAPACKLPDEIYRYISLVIPNRTETEILTGYDPEDDMAVDKAVGVFMRKGVENVIITRGGKGCVVAAKEPWKKMSLPAKEVEVVDSTAAGDTFCGALAVAMAEGKDLFQSAEFATLAASRAIGKLGAQESIPYRSEI